MEEQFWENKIKILKSNILSLNKRNTEITKVIDENYKHTIRKADKFFIKNYNKRHHFFVWSSILSGLATIILTIISWLCSEKNYGSGLGTITGIISSMFISLLIQTIGEYDKIKIALTVKKKYLRNISTAIEPILSDLLMSERLIGKNIDCALFKPTIKIEDKIININPADIAVNYVLLDEVIQRDLFYSSIVKMPKENFMNCIRSYKSGSKEKYDSTSRELYIIERNILQDNTLYAKKLFNDEELLALGKLRFTVEQIHNCNCKNDFRLINNYVVGMVQAVNLFVIAGLDITRQIYRYCGQEKISTYLIAAVSFKDTIDNMDEIKNSMAKWLDDCGLRKENETDLIEK